MDWTVVNALRALAAFWAAGLLGALAVGCDDSARGPRPTASIVPVAEGDFHITAPSSVRAGGYTFRVHNEGPTHHEFIIVGTRTGVLPLRPDGLTVDEESIERLEPGSLVPGAPGAVRNLTVLLKPGRYILFCNMEGHFMAGMHAELVVA
jgi:uncharacterized cupredoxin-like copper-binding protein